MKEKGLGFLKAKQGTPRGLSWGILKELWLANTIVTYI